MSYHKNYLVTLIERLWDATRVKRGCSAYAIRVWFKAALSWYAVSGSKRRQQPRKSSLRL